MKTFLKNVVSTVIGMVLAVIVIILLFIGMISSSLSLISSEDEVTIKENSILKIDLANTIVVERTSGNPFDGLNFSGDVATTIELKQVLDNIEKAKTDENIKAIYLNTSFVNAGISNVEYSKLCLLSTDSTSPLENLGPVYA